MVVVLLGLGVLVLLPLLSPLPGRSLRLPLWLTCRNERDLDRRLGGSGGGLLLLLLWSLDGDGVRRDASVEAAIASANALSETPECWDRSGLARAWGRVFGRGFWYGKEGSGLRGVRGLSMVEVAVVVDCRGAGGGGFSLP